ncbi:MAG: oligopeptide transporter, OPT family [candidate division Zixibacteria bacterium]|nr:oligopeptide transporter, OPT family [candidate division Zixibacteria bacterium]
MAVNNNNKFEPYIKANQTIPEVTMKAIILGALLSVIFGVANAYLGLKVGMTVSASIPAAVISMALLRSLFKKVTVLENNIVQTVGSAGESLAAGIIFTVPAFFIWNAQGFEYQISQWQIIGLSLLGGSLGILLMIPLRKYLVEREHGKLAFPEGTACSEIIVAGDEGGSKAKQVFIGIGLGAAYKIMMNMARLWPEIPNINLFWGNNNDKGLPGANIGMDATPSLLGVGYIIGPKIAALMFGGAVLGYIGIAPLLAYIGQQAPGMVIAPATLPLGDLDPGQLRNFYIKYLGVGAVALGGFVSLMKSIPVIVHSFSAGFSQLMGKQVVDPDKLPRTDRDLPLSTVLIGSLIVIVLIWLFPGTELHILGAAMAVVFGFFFVVVAARIVGIVGSSSSPVSGMTIATLLVTCLILLAFGVKGSSGMITAMSVGTVVCIAVCMSGDIAQDLKTGYLLGATPRKQQLTEFIGLLFPALAMGATIFLLNDAFGFVRDATHPEPLLAPQANVMATVVQGVMQGDLPWIPIICGAMIAASIELVGISSLPFAIGLYLPIDLSTPIMAGGLLALFLRKNVQDKNDYKRKQENGILFGSGLVAGDALIGVGIAGLVAGITSYRAFYEAHEGLSLSGNFGPWLSIICFSALILFYWWRVKRS